jgi:hypothetical protein
MADFRYTDFWSEDFDVDSEIIPGAGPITIPPTPNLRYKTFTRTLEGAVAKDMEFRTSFYSPMLKDIYISALINPTIIKDMEKNAIIQGVINQPLELKIDFEGKIIPLPPEFNINDIYTIYKMLKSL